MQPVVLWEVLMDVCTEQVPHCDAFTACSVVMKVENIHRGPKGFLHQAVNMPFNAVKLCILTWESVEIHSVL